MATYVTLGQVNSICMMRIILQSCFRVQSQSFAEYKKTSNHKT